MEKFVSGTVSCTAHSTVTYNVIGKNKTTALDEKTDDIEIVRESLHLDSEHLVTRLRITNTSDFMIKLMDAYPLICDDLCVEGCDSPNWTVLNGTRQLNDVPSACVLGRRDASFELATDRLSEEGMMLKSTVGGDAVITGDGITVIKAGKTYISVEIISAENQLTDISLSLDCNGSLRAVRAGGIFNCIIEPGDMKITDWVRVSVGGNFERLVEGYATHRKAVSPKLCADNGNMNVYAVRSNVTAENISDKLNFLSHMRAPFDCFMIGSGWQSCIGDWYSNGNFSDNMRSEAIKISNSGFKPGIWTAPFVADKNSELYRENKDMFLRHADGSVCRSVVNGRECAVLDVSSPTVIEWLEMLYQRLSAAGYYFHNVDFTNEFIFRKDVVLANPTVSSVEAYINAVETIKKAVGNEGVVYISNGFLSPLAGRADVVQICSAPKWNEISDNVEFFKKIVNQIAARRYTDLWWQCSCGVTLEGGFSSRFLPNELKMLAVCRYMCQGPVMAGDVGGSEELKFLRLFCPAVKTALHNRGVFEDMPYVCTVDIEVNDSYHTLCFFNYSNESVNLTFKLDNKTCGGYVDHSCKYDVSTYFSKECVRFAGYDDIIRVGKIEPRSAEVVKIAKSDKPHVLFSDMHLSMGGEVIVRLNDGEAAVFGENPFNCRGSYLIALPENCVCDDGKNEFSFGVNGQGSFSYKKRVHRR